MSESDDSNIKRYFCDKLHYFAFTDIVWPLEDILNILMAMAARLWIYATTLVRFIMDQHAVSPQRQLEDVLVFCAQWIQSNTKSNVTAELDAFYKMIMDHIPPEHHLSIVQQLLLIHHTVSRVVLHTLSNILDLTLDELKCILSKLHSILTFIPKERGWGEPFPRSVHISFYYASFMEFLLNKTRSGEYWLEDQRHYTALAIKVLGLFKALYGMNGISRGTLSIPNDISCSEDVVRVDCGVAFMYFQMKLSLLLNT